MRNPVFVKSFVKAIYEFNFNESAISQLKEIIPLDPNNLELDTGIKKWAPSLKERLPSMRGKLL